MKTYASKTEFIKRKSTGEIFQGSQIFLGKFDDMDDYADATQVEWDTQTAKREKDLQEEMKALQKAREEVLEEPR